jgi:multidrug efflux pump subunit AcrB
MTFLMFSTSSLYFLVAIYGENIESSKAHGLLRVEGQEDEARESGLDENKETVEVHNESDESPEQRLQEEQTLANNTDESKHIEGGEETEETLHQETSENQRRSFEFPLSVGAAVGYALIGLWMILDKRNSKIPYIVALVGSLVLLAIYFTSRTVGISILATEPIGLFDAIVAGIQVAIIAISSYILIGKVYTQGMAVGK